MIKVEMKRKALCAVMAVATALPLAAVARDRYEPFSAGAQIVEWLIPGDPVGCTASPGPNIGTGTINGSGLAIPIGAFTVTSQDCVTSDSPYGFYPPFAFSSSVLTLTTRNGDRIVASYRGSAELQPSGLLKLTGTYTLTGGTGQFQGVKGSGTLVGVEDISAFPARGFVTFIGKIAR